MHVKDKIEINKDKIVVVLKILGQNSVTLLLYNLSVIK
jgi:hypothetical protein